MPQLNLIELTSDREISRIIRYLDPDFQESRTPVRPHADFEGVVMLILLLGGVAASYIAMFLHVAE